MDIQQPKMTSYLNLIVRYLKVVLLLGSMPVAFAHEATWDCELTDIKDAFKQYVLVVDQKQVETIQNQLNISGYGELDVDGVLGMNTREAIQRLCVDYKVHASDHYTSELIELLEMTAAVTQQYPAWRDTINSEEFIRWTEQQPEEQQLAIETALQASSAGSVLEILDSFQNVKPLDVEEKIAATPVITTEMEPDTQVIADEVKEQALSAVEKVNATEQAAPIGESQVVTAPMFFYRWQPVEEEDEKAEENAEDDSRKSTVEKADETEEADENGDQKSACDPLPEDTLNALTEIQGKTYPNAFMFKQALSKLSKESGVDVLSCQDQILQIAQNGPVKDFQQIQLSGDGCGCSRDFTTVVYGFYPYWMSTEEVQSVDFSLFDRIGFYALSLDQEGKILDSLQWSNEWNAAGFINKAHKHRVNVDITIYASDWGAWNEENIDNAARNVVKTVTQPFHPSETSFFRTIFPFVEDTSSVTADGVTLFFDEYTTSRSSNNIVMLVEKVVKRLMESGSDARLNIMLGMDVNKIDKQHFENLESILLEEEGKSKVDTVFTFLQEPTTDTKKELRKIIENSFHGHDRKTVLRKLIPILTPLADKKDIDKKETKQFEDDLIYFQDNFAGVGFWPLPLNSHNQLETMKKEIIRQFKVEDGSSYLGGIIDGYMPWLCEFACPNRWLFRISFDLLAGLLALYALLAIWNCQLRGIFKQYILYFLAVGLATVLIFLISLVCDPFWSERADGVAFTVFIVALVVTITRYLSKQAQPPLP